MFYKHAILPQVFTKGFSRRSISTAPRNYTFHVGASFAGKPPDRQKLACVPFPDHGEIGRWRDRTLSWPKTVNSKDAGEDFFYVQKMRNDSGLSLGIADGVGGWVTRGIDPSLFSQAIMYHAARYSRNAWAGEPEIDPTLDYEEREQLEGWEMTPFQCLDLAYGGVMRERHVQAGSSTACLLTLNASSGVLRSANLGDSGFMIVRLCRVIYVQPPQTYTFNAPRQLAKLPAGTNRRRHATSYIDFPDQADVYEAKLRDGDIVILYTDGLSDNVFPAEISTICTLVQRSGIPENEQTQAMADRLVDYATQCMNRRSRVSPFEIKAERHGLRYHGGKEDDVTVVAALVRETN